MPVWRIDGNRLRLHATPRHQPSVASGEQGPLTYVIGSHAQPLPVGDGRPSHPSHGEPPRGGTGSGNAAAAIQRQEPQRRPCRGGATGGHPSQGLPPRPSTEPSAARHPTRHSPPTRPIDQHWRSPLPIKITSRHTSCTWCTSAASSPMARCSGASPARLDLMLPSAIQWPVPVSARR